jgi:hypothetical protein
LVSTFKYPQAPQGFLPSTLAPQTPQNTAFSSVDEPHFLHTIISFLLLKDFFGLIIPYSLYAFVFAQYFERFLILYDGFCRMSIAKLKNRSENAPILLFHMKESFDTRKKFGIQGVFAVDFYDTETALFRRFVQVRAVVADEFIAHFV